MVERGRSDVQRPQGTVTFLFTDELTKEAAHA
jgi:hypothetical protein